MCGRDVTFDVFLGRRNLQMYDDEDRLDFSSWFAPETNHRPPPSMAVDLKSRERMLNVFKGKVRRHQEVEHLRVKEKYRRRLEEADLELTTLEATEMPETVSLYDNSTECPNVIGCHPIKKDV